MGGTIILTALCTPFLFPLDYKNQFPDCSGELAFQWEQNMPERGCREKNGDFAEKGDERFSLNKKKISTILKHHYRKDSFFKKLNG